MKKLIVFNILLLFFFFLTLCSTDLSVQNENNPDAARALSEPKDVEGLIGGSYRNWWSNTQKSYPGMALGVAAWEITSSWGNFGMQNAGTEPRMPYDNRPTGRYRTAEYPWYGMYRSISAVNDGLVAINKGLKIGEDGKDNPRAKAFAKFVQGISHGFLGCFIDKAFIFTEDVDLETTQLELKPYNEVVQAAVQMLEECIQICESNSFTLPDTWINGLPLTNTELAQLAHSYIARFLLQVARSPEERAQTDWNKILEHCNQGIVTDFAPIGDGDYWWDRLKYQGQHPTWVRASYHTIGVLDKSGNFQKWINTPVADRSYIYITVDDKRITNGDPKSNGTDFGYYGPCQFRPDRGTYFFSYYMHNRYKYHYDNGATGPMPAFIVTELNLIKAEAMYELGMSGVADIINQTRVGRGHLPPATDSDSDLLEKLKYEKRIETFLTGSCIAFYDDRRWGDLTPGTPIHYPVPGKELEILQMEIYTFGGAGNPGSAPKLSNLPIDISLIPKPEGSLRKVDAGLKLE